jgi:predicted PhzF superfamily epimerase YddE/YHI9
MKLPMYQVDAFTDRVFSGNPAAVCPLENWLPEATMRAIAMENNLAETAFFVRRTNGEFDLRWFTPVLEIDLCGHATLASAFVVVNFLDPSAQTMTFHTKSGPLTVARRGDLFEMDFPSRPGERVPPMPGLSEALGAEPSEMYAARDYLAVYSTEKDICALDPDFGLLSKIDRKVIVTAPGDEVDFVSRFFAPTAGVPEDPVTGSSHCTLIPYWSARLGKTSLHARQVSKRGGELLCEYVGQRVKIAGKAVLYLQGELVIPSSAQ